MARVDPGASKGAEFLSIRGKRRSVSVGALRSKWQNEKGDYGGGRALVRVGEDCTDILIGRGKLEDWDEEELRRGKRRDKNGGWQGRDPIVVPKAIHDELVKRTLEDANKLFQTNLTKAIEILVEIMGNPKVDAKDRIAAIKMITDRAMGKEPQKVEIGGGDKAWEIAIAHSIVSLPGELVDQYAGNRETGEEELEDDDDVFG